MTRLIERLGRLPGLGQRSAQRIAFYLLKCDPQEAGELAAAIEAFRADLKVCRICGNVSETDPCPICQDSQRDHALVLVVEQPLDIASIEATGQYRGVYHVLMGRLSPLDGVGPGELNIRGLLERVRTSQAAGAPGQAQDAPSATGQGVPIHEVIIGTNPSLEGDGTALYLAQQLEQLGVRVTRLARGLPTGSSLETVSKAVLSDALLGRQTMR